MTFEDVLDQVMAMLQRQFQLDDAALDDLKDELDMRPLQAHCHRGLGTLYLTLGRPEQAPAVLSTAIELYRAMGMIFWLPQAEAALVRAGQVETPRRL